MAFRLRVTDSKWKGGFIARKTKAHPAGVVSHQSGETVYETLGAAQRAASLIMSSRGLTCVPEPFPGPKPTTTDAPATERGDVFHTGKHYKDAQSTTDFINEHMSVVVVKD